MTSAEGSPVVAPRPGSSFRVVMFGALCLVSSLFLARQHSTLVALVPSLGGFYEAGVTDLAASPPPGDEDEKDEDETRLLNIQQPDAGGDREVEAEVGPGGSPGPERSRDGSPDAPPRAAAHRETRTQRRPRRRHPPGHPKPTRPLYLCFPSGSESSSGLRSFWIRLPRTATPSDGRRRGVPRRRSSRCPWSSRSPTTPSAE